MLAQELLDFRSAMQQRGIIFAYSGYVTESVLSGVGDAVKQKLAIEDANTKTIRSVFSVFVEQMQNIIRYSAEKVPPDKPVVDGKVVALHQQSGRRVAPLGAGAQLYFDNILTYTLP